MTQASFDLRVGGRVWFDGQGWEVAELTGTAARLCSNGVVRTVSITSLADAQADGPDPVDLQHTTEIPAVVMAVLRQRTQLTARVDVLRGVLAPDPEDDRSILARYDAAAASLGVSRRTLQRQAARLVERGPAGLVDARLLQDIRRSVDPRWDAICLEVLSSYVNGSNPTKQSVITGRTGSSSGRRLMGRCHRPRSPTTDWRSSTRAVTRSGRRSGGGRSRTGLLECWARCGQTGRASTCCWTPTGWTCSRWSRSPCGG